MKGICIVGAGPTGLSLALFLHALKIPFRIIDKRTEPSSTSKALGVQPRTQEILQVMGLIKEFEAGGLPALGMEMFLGDERQLKLSFSKIDSDFKHILIHEQSRTEAVFIEALQARGVAVERDVEFLDARQENEQVHVSLRLADGNVVEETFDYLCGCDGPKSHVREVAGIPFEGVDDPERFYLADVTFEGDKPSEGIAMAQLAGQALTVIFPMPNQVFRLIVSQPERDVKILDKQVPVIEDFQTILNNRSLGRYRIATSSWRSYFYIHYKLAAQFSKGHIFLLGDSAHIHSPAGGQGMNTGIQDAFNLSWKLALVMRGEARPELLETYNLERREVARQVLKTSHFLLEMVSVRNPILKALRSLAWKWVVPVEIMQRHIANKIGQIDIRYPTSIDVAACGNYASDLLNSDPDKVGVRIANLPLGLNQKGEEKRLFDLYQPGKFVLLFYIEDSTQEGDVKACINNVLGRYPDIFELVLVVPHSEMRWDPESWDGRLFIDREKRFASRYGSGHSHLLLIRPDGFLAFKGSAADTAQLMHFLEDLLLTKTASVNS